MKIKVENLVKNYKRGGGLGVEVLKGVSLEIASGKKVALTGPSGAGKSTLIHILGHMDRPSFGNVFIDGKNYFGGKDFALAGLRKKHIGFMFQFHYLLADFNVLENMLLPVWDEREEKKAKALSILDKAGLSHRIGHFPNELSGGEQQRAALARALINDPKIIFADEPTGNLDRATGAEIEKILFDASTDLKASLVLVTHNEELAERADEIIKMKDGKIIGSP